MKKLCEICGKEITAQNFPRHKKTKHHILHVEIHKLKNPNDK